MPNHIHAILIIGGRGTAAAEKDPDPSITRRAPTAAAEKDPDPSITRRAPTAAAEKDPDPSITRRAPTAAAEKDLDPSITRRAPTEQFGKPVPGSIPTIIRSYKSAVSLRVNRLRDRPDHPVWQRNYYERVIRSDTEHQRVHDYIVGNPELWEEDPENPLLLVK